MDFIEFNNIEKVLKRIENEKPFSDIELDQSIDNKFITELIEFENKVGIDANEKSVKPYSDETMREFRINPIVIKKLFQRGYSVLAYQDNKLVGTGFLSYLQTFGDKLDWELKGLCVDPEFQKQGIGREITNRRVLKANENGIYSLHALTFNFNGSIGFFNKMGFQIEDKIRKIPRTCGESWYFQNMDVDVKKYIKQHEL